MVCGRSSQEAGPLSLPQQRFVCACLELVVVAVLTVLAAVLAAVVVVMLTESLMSLLELLTQ